MTLVSSATLEEYARQRKLALTLTREQLLQVDTVDRYLVLTVRARVSGAQLRSMTGSDLLRMAIDKGFAGSDLPSAVNLKRLEGNVAYVSFIKNGKELPGEFPLLVFTNSRWTIDLVETLRMSRPSLLSLFVKLADRENTDVNGAMLWTITKLIGHAPPDTIWDPPG